MMHSHSLPAALSLGILMTALGCVADVASPGGDGDLDQRVPGPGVNPGPGPGNDQDPIAPAPNPDPGATPDTNPPTPGEPHCTSEGPEVCDDDIDNNCDGNVDEGCTCTESQKSCYSGDPADLTVQGACRAGVQVCEREFYGPCEGEVLPSEEICDGIDNDCDGQADEGLGCNNAPPVPTCPSDQSGPPLANYTFVGEYSDPEGDAMASANWTIIDMPTGSTSRPSPSSGLSTEIFADVQGTYLLQLEVTDVHGGVGRCSTRLDTIGQDDLRVEVTWNIGAQGDKSDIDTHLLRDTNANWFDSGSTGGDCYFSNCRVCSVFESDTQAQEDACRDQIAGFNNDNLDIPPTLTWFPPTDGDDPRLDLDDVEGNGPENINIASPRPGTYRLGIHYWDADGFGDATVSVRIFCGGGLIEELEPVVLRDTGSFGGQSTEFWEVADIQWNGQGCQVRTFGQPGCRQICTRGQAEAGGCPNNTSRGTPCR